MPKMRHFRKMLRLEAKLMRHCFRNFNTTKCDVADSWLIEGYETKIKRSIASPKGNGSHRSKFPTGKLK